MTLYPSSAIFSRYGDGTNFSSLDCPATIRAVRELTQKWPRSIAKLIEHKAGKIEAVEKVYIRKSAQLIGDFHSAGVIIEDGGYIKGSIELSRHPART
jgi:hypothetical protein